MLSSQYTIKIMNEIKFNMCLIYYKYFNPYIINHYNLINKLNVYKTIGLSFYDKYPNASNWKNLNDELFKNNQIAEQEFNICLEQQKKIKIMK